MAQIVIYGRGELINNPGPYTYPSLEFNLATALNPVLSNGNASALKLISALGSIRNQRSGANAGYIIYETEMLLAFDKTNFVNDKFATVPADVDRLLVYSKGGMVYGLNLTFPVFDVLSGSFKVQLFGSDNGAAQTVNDTFIFTYTLVFEEIFN